MAIDVVGAAAWAVLVSVTVVVCVGPLVVVVVVVVAVVVEVTVCVDVTVSVDGVVVPVDAASLPVQLTSDASAAPMTTASTNRVPDWRRTEITATS